MTKGSVEDLADRIRASQALGRSRTLCRLFDFLVARADDVAAPKEAEVAAAIFDAKVGFDASEDASVRVYIHRLREKLDGYYANQGAADSERLSIPRGAGYRIVSGPQSTAHKQTPEPAPVPKPVSGPGRRPLYAAVAGGVALLLLVNAMAWFYVAYRPADGFAAVRQSEVWRSFLGDERPVTLVLGDYYVFGSDKGPGGEKSLVRERAVNSRDDLDNYLMEHPALRGSYYDLGLFYLPVSAPALQAILPILISNGVTQSRLHVVLASDLTPDLLKRTNVIYIGHLSGLAMLSDPVFSGSRFYMGQSADQLIDSVTKRRFESQDASERPADAKLKEFGYFSTFTGPNGNRIMVITGTSDVAVMQIAETMAKQDELSLLARAAKGVQSFEALYEIEGIAHVNLGGRLLNVFPLRTDRIWTAQSDPAAYAKAN